MSKYTTIRVPVRTKERLKNFARKIKARSLADAIEKAIDMSEKEYDKFKGDVKRVLKSLEKAKDIGETNAEKVDEYLYGG
ncbi:MAG: hypothetical protein J7L07_06175 [Candidatus Odinarchaeota archaeon]|nr:hypothetical protein [Candidatus Odinarchaeota archaeon]